jgi:ferredoxin
LAYTTTDGFFRKEHLNAAEPRFASAQTYLCGPPGLMRGVREVFEAEGLGERLHTEDFTPVAPAADAAAEGTVTFNRSNLTGENSGRTLLEQAEFAGLRPVHGCRMGICFSCTQIKRTGCVRDIRSGDVSSEEDEEIQLCVSVPVGDVAIDL